MIIILAASRIVLPSNDPEFEFKMSARRGSHLLVVNGVKFFRNRQRNDKQYWKCHQYYKRKCPCTVVINEATSNITVKFDHNHDESVTSFDSSTAAVRVYPNKRLK